MLREAWDRGSSTLLPVLGLRFHLPSSPTKGPVGGPLSAASSLTARLAQPSLTSENALLVHPFWRIPS